MIAPRVSLSQTFLLAGGFTMVLKFGRFGRVLTSGVGLLCAAALSAVPACSSSSSSSSDNPTGAPGTGVGTLPIPNADVALAPDLKLHPDVVTIHGGLAVLHRVSEDHGVWTLDKAAPGVATLAPGKILLLAGLDVARVTAIVDRGAEVDVSVAPVGFAEVLTDGKLTLDKGAIDPARNVVIRAPTALYVGTTTTASARVGTSALRSGVHPLTGDVSSTFKVTLADNWEISLAPAVGADGALDLTIAAQRASAGTSAGGTTLGAVEMQVNAKAHITNIKNSSGSVSVSGGGVNDASVDADLGGFVEVEAIAKSAAAGQFPKQALIRIPIAMEFPFPCGGLPCYVSVQAAFLAQPSLATTNSGISVKGRFDLSGNAAMNVASGTGTPSGSVTVGDPGNLADQATSVPSAGTTAMVFAIQAPRLGIGLGTLSAFGGVKVGVFADAVNSFGYTVAGATALVPCRTLDWIFGAHAGGEMTVKLFAGLSVNQEHQFEIYKTSKTFAVPDIAACHP
jgi:hypothetical protein